MTITGKRKKLIVGVVVFIGLIALIIANLNRNSKNEGESFFSFGSKSGLSVEVEAAQLRDIESTVSASGFIQPLTKVNISPRISGEIVELTVREGSKVKKNDLLLKLDSKQFEAALKQAEANYRVRRAAVDSTKASLENTQREYERKKSLFKEGVISEKELELAQLQLKIDETNYQTALENVDQAKSNLDRAKDELAKTIILSPMNGIVSRLNVELGEVVLGSISSPGTIMMTISDFSQMLVNADVEETNVVEIEIGQKVRIIIDAFPDKEFTGILKEIANTARQKGDISVFPVEVLIEDNIPKLLPGMSADIEIITRKHKNTLAVPIQAVLHRKPSQVPVELDDETSGELKDDEKQSASGNVNDENVMDEKVNDQDKSKENEDGRVQVVYLYEDGKAKGHRVETGLSDDTYMEIISGIKKGDLVIVGPYRNLEKLKDGLKVRLKKEKQDQGNKSNK